VGSERRLCPVYRNAAAANGDAAADNGDAAAANDDAAAANDDAVNGDGNAAAANDNAASAVAAAAAAAAASPSLPLPCAGRHPCAPSVSTSWREPVSVHSPRRHSGRRARSADCELNAAAAAAAADTAPAAARGLGIPASAAAAAPVRQLPAANFPAVHRRRQQRRRQQQRGRVLAAGARIHQPAAPVPAAAPRAKGGLTADKRGGQALQSLTGPCLSLPHGKQSI